MFNFLARRSFSSVEGTKKGLLRVQLKRGLIGLPSRFKEHVRALGLRHTHEKSYVPINPMTIGNILKVKELVQVKNVKGKPPKDASYWSKGYSIVTNKLTSSQ